jgi:hypothetical protein
MAPAGPCQVLLVDGEKQYVVSPTTPTIIYLPGHLSADVVSAKYFDKVPMPPKNKPARNDEITRLLPGNCRNDPCDCGCGRKRKRCRSNEP